MAQYHLLDHYIRLGCCSLHNKDLCCTVTLHVDRPRSRNLLEETKDSDLFKDPKMLQRFQDTVALPEVQRKSLLLNIDHFIRSAKISMI